MNDEGVAAILGLVLLQNGGDVRIPADTVANGLPSNSRVQVSWDEDELVVGIREIPDDLGVDSE